MTRTRDEAENELRLSKRQLLALGAGAVSVLTPLGKVFAQAGAGTANAPPTDSQTPRPAMPRLSAENVDQVLRRRLGAPNACTVAPQTVEGPYYLDQRLLRSDIRENQVGEPLKLRLQVLDANAICDPLGGALVSVWQGNAFGFYSGYHDVNPDLLVPAPGSNFRGHQPEHDTERWLRGVQPTDQDGWVTFMTVFPGWYTLRAPHIHVRVFKNEREMATTQFLFSQALVNNVFAKPPYAKRGPGIITNENDMVRAQSNLGPSAIFETERDETGLLVATGRVGLSHG